MRTTGHAVKPNAVCSNIWRAITTAAQNILTWDTGPR